MLYSLWMFFREILFEDYLSIDRRQEHLWPFERQSVCLSQEVRYEEIALELFTWGSQRRLIHLRVSV